MLEQLRPAWDNLQPRQRLALVATVLASIIGLGVVGWWSSRPTYAVLFNSLAAEDASAITEELQTDKVPYRLAASGTAIEVPAASLYETRLKLAGKGVPTRSGTGFELFDRSGLPGTDFSNAVTMQRALQGELARTICSLQEVRTARVLLALPHDDLYSDPTPPSASVLLDLGASGALSDEQVRGIVWLVASAVEKLRPEGVTVVDTMGRVLHGSEGFGGGADDSALTSSRRYSEAMTTRLQTMLDAVFGPHRTIVRAQADLDLDDEETNEERVEPVTPHATDAVSREQSTEESFQGGGGGAGGVAGVPANILGTSRAASAPDGAGAYKNKQETREYQFSKRTTRRERRPGRITRISVAAVVDEEVAAAGVTRVQEILEAAAGVNPTRGDAVVVRSMKLSTAELAAKEEKAAEADQTSESRRRLVDSLLRWILPVAVAALLLSLLGKVAGEVRRTTAPVGPTGGGEAQDRATWAEGVAGEIAQEDSTQQPAAPMTEEEELLAELRRVAREQPDVLADELRNLVSGQDEA